MRHDGGRKAGGARRARATAAIALATAACLVPAAGRAQSADDWFGRDKMLHAGVSAPLGALASTLAGRDAPVGDRLLVGAVLGSLPGLAKELIDLRRPGSDPSARDMAANVAGALVGALFADCCIVRPLTTAGGRLDGVGIEIRLSF